MFKLYRIMMNRLFNELFGEDVFDKMVGDFFESVKELEKNEENEKDENQSYFHRVTDEYENGKKISHKEKEVKNGEVLKDINENYKIEDKTNKDKNTENEMTSEEALEEAKKLLDEARSTISMQMKEIERNQKRCKELEEELNNFKNGIRALL